MQVRSALLALAVLAVAGLSLPAFAQQKYLGEFKDWFAYRENKGPGGICQRQQWLFPYFFGTF